MYKQVIVLGLVGLTLCGCASYSNPNTYANLACQDMRDLYGNSARRLLLSTNLPSSALENAKPGEVIIGDPGNALEDLMDKQESDLRAAYKANGC